MSDCTHDEKQYEYDAQHDRVKATCKRCGIALGGTLGNSYAFDGCIVTTDPEDFMRQIEDRRNGRGGAGVPVR